MPRIKKEKLGLSITDLPGKGEELVFDSPLMTKIGNSLQAKFGQHAFYRATGQFDPRRIPTGIFALDRYLGGGVPVNRITLINGWKATYKSLRATKIIANYQMRCSRCLMLDAMCTCSEGILKRFVYYNDVEKRSNESHMVRAGVNPDTLIMGQPLYGEEACEVTEEVAKSGEVGLIVVDSLAALAGKDEIESGYTDSISRGIRARLIARMCRALISLINRAKNPCTVIAINHLLPLQNGAGSYLPGGDTQKYLSTVVLNFSPLARERTKVSKEGEENTVKFDANRKPILEEKTGVKKQKMSWLIEHSAICPENISGEFMMFLEEEDGVRFGDADDWLTVFLYGQQAGLIEQNEKEAWVVEGIEGAFKTQKAIFDIWKNDPVAFATFKEQLAYAR